MNVPLLFHSDTGLGVYRRPMPMVVGSHWLQAVLISFSISLQVRVGNTPEPDRAWFGIDPGDTAAQPGLVDEGAQRAAEGLPADEPLPLTQDVDRPPVLPRVACLRRVGARVHDSKRACFDVLSSWITPGPAQGPPAERPREGGDRTKSPFLSPLSPSPRLGQAGQHERGP